jgi:putative transposase
MRQHFFGVFFLLGSRVRFALSLKLLYAIVKPTEDYKSLPAKVSNQVLKQVIHDWSAWQKARGAYYRESHLFSARPYIPKYKHKSCGGNWLIYDNQSIGKRGKYKNNGRLNRSKVDIIIATQSLLFREVRRVTKNEIYMIEVVDKKPVFIVN